MKIVCVIDSLSSREKEIYKEKKHNHSRRSGQTLKGIYD